MLHRFKILQNICTVFVKTGQYNDAINTYEHIHSELKDKVDFRTCELCGWGLGGGEGIGWWGEGIKGRGRRDKIQGILVCCCIVFICTDRLFDY